MDVGQVFEGVGVIDGAAEVGDRDVAPAFDWRTHHEQVAHDTPAHARLALFPKNGMLSRFIGNYE